MAMKSFNNRYGSLS